MSSSTPSQLRFLLDENVKQVMYTFLKSKGVDVCWASKGAVNGQLAALSLTECRILVTNDLDFGDSVLYPKSKVFGVLWLAIPQYKTVALLNATSSLLKAKQKPKDYKGRFITLKEDGFDTSEIGISRPM